MPYLQLDVNGSYPAADKRRLAAQMSQTYARMMSVDIRRVSIAIRELGDGGVWRVTEAGADPLPVSVLMLDIRRGRPAGLRMELANALSVTPLGRTGSDEEVAKVVAFLASDASSFVNGAEIFIDGGMAQI